MAKKKKKLQNDAEKKSGNGVFIFAGIFLAVATAVFMIILYTSFSTTKKVYDETIASIEAISGVNEQISAINRNVQMLVAGVAKDASDTKVDIDRSFRAVDQNLAAYENASKHSALELYRYNQAKLFIEQYKNKINTFSGAYLGNGLTSVSIESNKNLYVQEVQPLQTTASEMIEATIDIAELETADKIRAVQTRFYTAEILLLAVAIVGEAAIFVIARISKKNKEALARQAAEIEAATQKFRHTKEKASEMAYTNILTGMKNRYALDQDISPRLETDQFNVAVFDMDNFRSINDMYGYDFGDEYLAILGERLKEEYGNDAEIYNITGNEFCFIFNRDITDVQASRISQSVIQTLCQWYTVLNINVQLTASGSYYHYLPGDCISVSALLVKMDNVLREAKRNGGNMILQVVGM